MLGTNRDYSNTFFYKIYCKDPNITDLYIGHTVDFVKRKKAHEQSCKNSKNTNYNCKLYKIIRDNHGWDNWKMDVIAHHQCEDLMSAKKYEQQYYEEYKATLNSIEPLPPLKQVEKKENSELYCKLCNIYCTTIKTQQIHNNTNKHLKRLLNNNNIQIETTPIITNKFICEKCHFTCKKQSNWNIHLLTNKHKNRTSTETQNKNILIHSSRLFKCECGKEYTARNSLWYHKKTCSNNQRENTKNTSTDKDMDELSIKMVDELSSKLAESMKQIATSLVNSNNETMEKVVKMMVSMNNK